jgi:hypothetical protein
MTAGEIKEYEAKRAAPKVDEFTDIASVLASGLGGGIEVQGEKYVVTQVVKGESIYARKVPLFLFSTFNTSHDMSLSFLTKVTCKIRADEWCEQGLSGIIVVTTKTAVVIGFYDEPKVASNAVVVLDRYAEYMKSVNC